MKMVKIQIADRHQRAKGFSEIARRGRVMCFRNHVFIVPEPALGLLEEMGVCYVELGRGGVDYAKKAMRDALEEQSRRN